MSKVLLGILSVTNSQIRLPGGGRPTNPSLMSPHFIKLVLRVCAYSAAAMMDGTRLPLNSLLLTLMVYFHAEVFRAIEFLKKCHFIPKFQNYKLNTKNR